MFSWELKNFFPMWRRGKFPAVREEPMPIVRSFEKNRQIYNWLSEASVMKSCKLSATVLRKAGLLLTFVSCISQLNLILHSHVLTFLTTICYVKLTLKTVPMMLIGFPIWRTNSPPFTRTLGSIICSSILTTWNKFTRMYKHQNTDWRYHDVWYTK